MAYRATYIDQDPVDYFIKRDEHGASRLNVADVVLRANQDPKEIFAHMIRFATNSNWSHCALALLLSNIRSGYNSTFLIESMTRGVRLADWRKTIVPYKQYTVGIKRLALDWYAETPYEQARHSPRDPEDTHGAGYLRHVRGVALDQVNSLYDHDAIFELAALYVQRVARRHLVALPLVALLARMIANFFRQRSIAKSAPGELEQFICGGLIQYSFFEALRISIIKGLKEEQDQEAAQQNLSHLHRVIFCSDPDRVIANYIRQVQLEKIDLADPVPEDVLDLLKAATPADFNNSPNLKWEYVILRGKIWEITEVDDDYEPQSTDEAEVLQLLKPEHSRKPADFIPYPVRAQVH
ncbi:MAG: hypothetical protein PVS3B1_24020 [Ktedonobacteraceae bacterium]